MALKRRREAAREDREENTVANLADSGDAVGEDLERIERQHQVRTALAGASERCKRLIEALYYEDPTPSYAELSQRLGVPVGSLGPTRARCMERLKDHFEDVQGDSGGISED